MRTAESVAQMIAEARRSMGPLRFGHGLDLDRCCVPPRRVSVEVAATEVIECWSVLEDDRGSAAGYSIVYDERSGAFGLALRREGAERVLVGWYGSFRDALEAM